LNIEVPHILQIGRKKTKRKSIGKGQRDKRRIRFGREKTKRKIKGEKEFEDD
jgi:prolyl-tRNA synthetase